MGANDHNRATHEQELIRKGLIAMDTGALTPVRSGNRWFNLLTPKSYAELPDGTTVVSVFSFVEYVKGRDTIDLNVRGGQIAYGLPLDEEQSAQLDALYRNAF